MVRTTTPICSLGKKAPDFSLIGVDNNKHTLKSCSGVNGLLVMFICNHCPYVKAIIDKIIIDVNKLKSLEVGSVAIMSNDPDEYPEDSFANMQIIAKKMNFPFSYLLDKTQQVAKDYGAVCTPDFFGYNKDLKLQYRGRLNASRKESVVGVKNELFDAMRQIATTGRGPKEQIPSIGCSIKWL